VKSDETRAGTALILKGVQMGGTKVFYLLGTLVLGRLLTPDDFGLVAIATVAVLTLMTATDTGMTAALVQHSGDDPRQYDVAWTIGLIRGVIVSLVLLLAAPAVAALFGDPKAISMIRLMSLMPFILSVNSPRLADLMRELKFGSLAVFAVVAVVVELTISISLARRLGGAAIIIGKLCGAGVTCVTSYIIAPYRPRFMASYGAARSLIAFGRWLFAIGLMAVASDLFLKVLIARQVGVAALGLFSLADRLAETASQLASEATGSVAFPLYARLRGDSTRVQGVLRAQLIGFMFFLLPASALVIGLAPALEIHVLGPAWAGTSPVIILLTLGYAAEVTFLAVSPLLKATGAGRQLFGIELLQYGVLISSVALLCRPLGIVGAGIARILASIALLIATAWTARGTLGFPLPAVSRPALSLLLLSGFAGVVAWLCAGALNSAAGVALAGLAGGVTFLACVFIADQPLGIGVRASLGLFFPALVRRPAMY
jgi:PST family polysaccharide transporter